MGISSSPPAAANAVRSASCSSPGKGSWKPPNCSPCRCSVPTHGSSNPPPAGPAEATPVIEEPFERGRVLYIQSRNRVYTLFNDGRAPAWLSFENRYNPAIHPESEESFVPPPGLVQPLRIIGFVWRGNDTVRNRLGLGVQAETTYDGFVQTIVTGTDEQIYVSSADGTVLHLIPGGDIWEIITPPSS